MITDSAFIAAADATIATIGLAIDAALESRDADVDWSVNDGILEIECGADGKLIVNRHVGNRELWVAAKAGGFHFCARDGRWHDTRSGEELGATLARLLKSQAGLAVKLPALAAPAS